jgi:peptide/nickel transport system permease protein
MSRALLFRPMLVVLILVGANLGGFAYAHLARTMAGNPFFARQADAGALWPAYVDYVTAMLGGDTRQIAVYGTDFLDVLARATVASAGLLAIALVVSVGMGLALGLLGVRLHPPGVRGWLTGLSIVGLSTPSFFAGRLAVALMLLAVLALGEASTPLPIRGFGWDAHLVLPVIALSIRPTAQIAQVVSGLLAAELGKQYIVAARGKGLDQGRVVAHHAMRNIWAPTAHALAGTVRLLVAELIVVEWLFAWPGIGYLMAATLVPAELASANVEARFLDPPLVASIITIFALIFVAADLMAGLLAALVDPRQRHAR